MSDTAWPHNATAEREVMSCAVLGAAEDVLDQIGHEDLTIQRYRDILDGARECTRRGMAVDLVTLPEVMGHRFDMATLSSLYDQAGSTRNLGHYIEMLKRHSAARRVIEAGAKVQMIGRDESLTAVEIADQAEAALLGATASSVRTGMVSARDAFLKHAALMQAAQLAEGGVTGLRTGLTELDEHTGGLQPGWLVLVLAQAKMGKTAFTMGDIVLPAAKTGTRCVVFSLEMPSEQIMGRLHAAESGVPVNVQRRQMTQPDWDSFNAAADVMCSLPLSIMDPDILTPTTLRTRARRAAQGAEHPLIVVDYLQLMSGDDAKENATETLAACAKAGKMLALELGATVVMLVQPTSESERARGRRLTLPDIRGGQAIGAAADLVLVPYRPAVHKESPSREEKAIGEINVDAFRHGEGKMRYSAHWNGARMLFEDPRQVAPRGMGCG
jgi:replicative DNA helicase